MIELTSGQGEFIGKGWLVELGDAPQYTYLAGITSNGLAKFTADHLWALRFARQVDAERLRDKIGIAGRCVEHSWSDDVAKTEALEGQLIK